MQFLFDVVRRHPGITGRSGGPTAVQMTTTFGVRPLSRGAASLLAALLLASCAAPPARNETPSKAVPQEVPVAALKPDVRHDTVMQTICRPGYT